MTYSAEIEEGIRRLMANGVTREQAIESMLAGWARDNVAGNDRLVVYLPHDIVARLGRATNHVIRPSRADAIVSILDQVLPRLGSPNE